MSADLFAEFGAEPAKDQQQQQPVASSRPVVQQADSFAFFDGWSSTTAPVPSLKQASQSTVQHSNAHPLATVAAATGDDNDDWGDFEGGTTFEPIKQNPDPFAFQTSHTTQPSQLSNDLWTIASDAQDPFQSNFTHRPQAEQTTWQKAPIVKAKKPADSSVLFDAEDDFDDDDDDDFGDFEGTETKNAVPNPAPITSSSSALVDLLGDMNLSEAKLVIPSTIKKDGTKQHAGASSSSNKTLDAGFGKASKHKKSEPSVSSKIEKDDSWDTFDDWEASIPSKLTDTSKSGTMNPSHTPSRSTTAPQPILSPTTTDPTPGELPPTNVPPPGVLLSLFPSLFSEAQEKLFKPMAAQTLPMRNKLMAEPATIAYLQGYLMLANVAAHIIAGRKLRWKRDQHLSQGMRIGPASSRATSGMKLTGIDKGENMKEEREASDVVRAWKEQIGRLRHVISGINQIKADTLGRGPDLQETMPVRTLKQSEGGIPARQPCMLCGLKREERVTAADVATDDSFGEWWIDQVNMHRGCRNFWNEHKDTLRQR